jgi:APA family basic amino acid/polyamine antiporter
LVDRNPELRERAKFKLSKLEVKEWAGAGILCGIFVIVAGWTADWRPYAILGAWFAIGCAYWVARGQRVSRSMRLLQNTEAA